MVGRFITHVLLACAVVLCLGGPVRAETSDKVLDALNLDGLLRIMRTEGLEYGRDMALDMFGRPDVARWSTQVSDIYDIARMETLIRRAFEEALDAEQTRPLHGFLTSEEGARIIGLELSAREAMVDPDTEEAARAAFRAIDGEDQQTLRQIEAFIRANDLIEANVAGAMNASYQFYRGLADGGALALTESEMLADVWSQEEETRDDTREWLFAFLLLAYSPLEAEVLDDYVAFSSSPPGRALNGALFAAFNEMYDSISYALGLAAAGQMTAQDL